MHSLIEDLLARRFEVDLRRRVLPWYRGQTADFPLAPTLLRKPLIEKIQATWGTTQRWTPEPDHPAWWSAIYWFEEVVNSRFRREAATNFVNPDDFSDVYMQARHVGVPSRLLDWTTDPLIALYWATLEDTHNNRRTGRIHMLHPNFTYAFRYFWTSGIEVDTGLSPIGAQSEVFRNSITKLFDEVTAKDYMVLSQEEWSEEMRNNPFTRSDPQYMGGILGILPSLTFPRIAGQSGCFTFHPRGSENFDLGSKTEAIVIKAQDKESIRRDLRKLGYGHNRALPSMDSLALDLQEELLIDPVSP